MAEEFDTSWFDLKNYEVFKTMTIDEWVEQLALRVFYHNRFSQYKEGGQIFLHSDKMSDDEMRTYLVQSLELATSCLKMGDRSVIVRDHTLMQSNSVLDLAMLDVFEMAQDDRFIRVRPDKCNNNFFEENEDLFEEMSTQPFGFWNNESQATIKVNLYATDEQIQRDFSQWLTDCRQKSVIKPPKKILSQTKIDYWIQYGVIPYIDLVLISRFEGKRITQYKLAQLIFPDEYDVDIVGRLRQVTKPEAARIINNNFHKTLYAQSSLKT